MWRSARWRRYALADGDLREALERTFRTSQPRLIAALTRRFGVARLDLIENAVQDASLRGLERWTATGLPDDAEGWLLRVAHNAVVDVLRGEARRDRLAGQDVESLDPPELAVDDELRLIFLSCHPVLSRPAQLALTLKIAFGFSVAQLSRAFLSDERTIAQRIVRAKQRLRDEGVRFELPDASEIPQRLEAILDVLYLVFGEAHVPTELEAVSDAALTNEAVRLSRLLASTADTAAPEVQALHALFCFHASRAPARRADDGSPLLLAEQDRSRWDADLLQEGFLALGKSARGEHLSRFHLEAAIAACHASAETWAATDWPRIAGLYDALRSVSPSPIVEVNRAMAIAMCSGAQAGLDALDAIPERELITRYPYALAGYAELHASLGDLEQARAFLDRALEHQPSPSQRALLVRKRGALERS